MHDIVAVVIATYNEIDTIRQVLDGLVEYPVVVVDDNSPDGTGQVVKEHENARLISRSGKSGLASAYVCGFRHALRWYKPTAIVQMDAGMTHDPADVPRLLAWLEYDSVDLVIGSRFMGDSRIADTRSVLNYRTVLSLGAAWAMRRLGVRVSDATCGFRCWRASLLREVLTGWEPLATGFAFQLEMLYRAWALSGGAVFSRPIEYRLTNSSFRWGMLAEALRVYARLRADHMRRRDT
jgi:dolichol-phosphate mannosyltransferase